ncbi:MAG: lysine--tRNA ligase [Candidatus Schekmanbacteria bacterium RBG_16_38_11]|uniref:Lysine--tRNA ligase n=1 Tax=Candidatus Schekmanbacteria bacterium RBG_16_38_11 TaxID=1817880 RepID=A0A1F7RWW7_9BACT|nr:MAG: lysine--tRNA ligase [Candidatus Schekmanbacteria bacterium RBG_16_38_11]
MKNEENELIVQRKNKIEELKSLGLNPYPNDFKPTHSVEDIKKVYGEKGNEELEGLADEVKVAGRMITVRLMGKTTFAHIQDFSGKMQVMLRENDLGESNYGVFKKLFDIGDFIGVRGKLFRTKTGELTIWVKEFKLLTKSLRPLPEKWHGLKDIEIRYRQRYVDLIVNPDVKKVFEARSRVIRALREFMDNEKFLEVETPMMQPIPGGAEAKPFKTFHNALGMELYLRIAPELYLKRLVVGGLERVYEINRNFRNEGISTQHNPEFTMMEFYMAYETYHNLMEFTERLITFVAQKVFDSLNFKFGDNDIDFTPPWERIGLISSIEKYAGISHKELETRKETIEAAKRLGIKFDEKSSRGKIILKIFETLVEPQFIKPTFVYDFPIDVSPLSRRKEEDQDFVERFELYIGGLEIANAFSELNDPQDQKERFLKQVAEREEGDQEAHMMDEDYIRALEHGMPPTAGEGIGIDRLAMLLTNSSSIRDVILFPQMRKET